MDPGTAMLRQMSRAHRFNRWMADTIEPFVGNEILEIGAGIGNLTEFLCPGRQRYVATDSDGEHLALLRARLKLGPNLETAICEASDPRDFMAWRKSFDTAICLNVLEHIPNDEAALANIFTALRPAGRAIILVPQGAAAFGSLDEVLLHQRRYSEPELTHRLSSAAFHVERVIPFNRITYPGWILNSRILRRRTLSDMQLRYFDALVPVWRRIDRYLPFPSTSLIAIGRRD